MYNIIGCLFWIVLTFAITIFPLIPKFRKWVLSYRKNTWNDDPIDLIYDYCEFYEDGVDTFKDALYLMLSWFLISAVCSGIALILSLVWPLILMLVPLVFVFYKLFKNKS